MNLSKAAAPGQVTCTSTPSANDGEGGNGAPRASTRDPKVPGDGPSSGRDPSRPLSQLLVSGKGKFFVTLHDAVGRDLRGRETVLCMVLNEEEEAEVRRRAANAQEDIASGVVGGLPRIE